MITTMSRGAAWLLVLAAIVLTLGPQKFRPYTGIEHDIEHGLAFALVGIAFGMGYPKSRLLMAALAVAAAALMEILQQWVPGRHAYFSDFVINGLGACAGIAAATLLDRLRRR